jgi:hypothetical protein
MPRTLINNGRVTSRDPSLHGEGEVSEAQDCYYAPADPALRSVGGRAAFNSSAESGALVGGAYLEFDSADALIAVLGRGATKYRKATSGLTGTFSDLSGFDASDYSITGSATILDVAHYRDQHILVNGVDRPRVVLSDGTQMFLGMLETTEAPALSRDGGGATGFILSSAKTITYWIEERVKIDGAIVKRSSPATAAQVDLTGDGTTDKPRLTQPTLLNPDTTHWALFATATDGLYPIGAEIAEEAIGTTFIDDDRIGTDPGLPSGSAFSIVSLTIGGLTLNKAKYGPPPIGTSVEIFEDAVMMNDSSKPSEVPFCFTDDIHAWPAPFRIKFSTKFHDEVKAIREMDDFALVLLRDAVWRVNTLPKSSDQAFEPERIKAEVEGAFGIVNSRALAKFSFGEGERLGYISPYGAVVTDGSRWSTISDDMAWEESIEIEQASKIRLINNVRFYRLDMGYPAVGDTRATETAFLHYHPSHAKSSAEQGGLRAKMTWPIHRDVNDMFVGKISGIDVVFSANEDGKVYVHDQGFSEPVVSGGIVMKVRTSDDYPGDVGLHATLRDVWAHHQAASGEKAKVRVISRNSGEPDATGEVEIPLDRREATPTGKQGKSEAFQFEFEVTNPSKQIVLDYFAPDYDFGGKSEAK